MCSRVSWVLENFSASSTKTVFDNRRILFFFFFFFSGGGGLEGLGPTSPNPSLFWFCFVFVFWGGWCFCWFRAWREAKEGPFSCNSTGLLVFFLPTAPSFKCSCLAFFLFLFLFFLFLFYFSSSFSSFSSLFFFPFSISSSFFPFFFLLLSFSINIDCLPLFFSSFPVVELQYSRIPSSDLPFFMLMFFLFFVVFLRLFLVSVVFEKPLFCPSWGLQHNFVTHVFKNVKSWCCFWFAYFACFKCSYLKTLFLSWFQIKFKQHILTKRAIFESSVLDQGERFWTSFGSPQRRPSWSRT